VQELLTEHLDYASQQQASSSYLIDKFHALNIYVFEALAINSID